MRNGLTIDIRDTVSGRCPACRAPRIKLVYDTGFSGGYGFEAQRYVLRCEHQDVCKLREEYARETE